MLRQFTCAGAIRIQVCIHSLHPLTLLNRTLPPPPSPLAPFPLHCPHTHSLPCALPLHRPRPPTPSFALLFAPSLSTARTCPPSPPHAHILPLLSHALT